MNSRRISNRGIERLLKEAFRGFGANGCGTAEEEAEKAYVRRTAGLVRRGSDGHISFCGFLLRQIRFIGLRMWAVQTALFAALAGCLWVCMGRDFWQEERYVARYLCGLSLAVSVSALPFLCRTFRYRMHEIEASARYSFAGVLLAKMLMTALGDAVLLGGAFVGAAAGTELAAGSILFYLLLPFVLASWLGLGLMGRVSAAVFPAACMTAGALLLAALGAAGRLWDGVYTQTFTPGWTAVCVLLALACVRQARALMQNAVCPEFRTA